MIIAGDSSKKADDATDNPENNSDDAAVMTKQAAELSPPERDTPYYSA